MLQRVSFPVAGSELGGVIHLPDRDPIGHALVLHGYGGHPEQPHIVAACEALAAARVAAMRFAYRDHDPPRMTLDSGLADARAALTLLRAHKPTQGPSGVVGFSYGGSVAAMLAGRDGKIAFAVLCAAPAAFQQDARPVMEIVKTKAAVLLLWGSRDTQVPFAGAERYAGALSAATRRHETRLIEGGDHDFAPAAPRAAMAAAVAGFAAASLS